MPKVKRVKMFLTEEEAEEVRHQRRLKTDENWRIKQDARPRCEMCVKENQSYKYPAQKDGLCGFHWNSLYKPACGFLVLGEYPCGRHPKQGEKFCSLHK